MAQEDLDALLSRMPSIAEAINAFTSETVQQEAFAALVAAFEGKRHSARHATTEQAASAGDQPEATNDDPKEQGTPALNGKTKKRKPAGTGKSDWTMVRELDLHPTGKKSFEEFAAEKQPKSHEDKYALIVYYLEQILELPAVTRSHIGTVFRLTSGWPEPISVGSGLRTTASRKGTIDTSNPENIKTTPNGRNFVELKLPASPKTK